MDEVISACGVLCSECAAYGAASRGPAWQREVAEAWHRIYGLNENPGSISCGGCSSADDQVFHTCVHCAARVCCRSKGFRHCSECPREACELLAAAQSLWDTVPEIGANLSAPDYARYARPYCGHRERLEAMRRK